jgi:glutathione S-transferase
MRKVEGGLRALNTWVEQRKGDYLVQNRLTYADIATCSVLGFMNVRWPQHNWKEQYPGMEKYFRTLDERPSFANTRPSPQKFTDPVV